MQRFLEAKLFDHLLCCYFFVCLDLYYLWFLCAMQPLQIILSLCPNNICPFDIKASVISVCRSSNNFCFWGGSLLSLNPTLTLELSEYQLKWVLLCLKITTFIVSTNFCLRLSSRLLERFWVNSFIFCSDAGYASEDTYVCTYYQK